MTSTTLFVIGMLGAAWLITGSVIITRDHWRLTRNVPKLGLFIIIVFLVLFTSVVAELNGW